MGVVKIIIGVIEAILKASVSAFLALLALGATWTLVILAAVAALLVGLFGVGGLKRAISRRKSSKL